MRTLWQPNAQMTRTKKLRSSALLASQYGSNPVAVAHFAWRSSLSLKPSRKIPEFDFVFHANVCD
jgi:hypothetical protein